MDSTWHAKPIRVKFICNYKVFWDGFTKPTSSSCLENCSHCSKGIFWIILLTWAFFKTNWFKTCMQMQWSCWYCIISPHLELLYLVIITPARNLNQESWWCHCAEQVQSKYRADTEQVQNSGLGKHILFLFVREEADNQRRYTGLHVMLGFSSTSSHQPCMLWLLDTCHGLLTLLHY